MITVNMENRILRLEESVKRIEMLLTTIFNVSITNSVDAENKADQDRPSPSKPSEQQQNAQNTQPRTQQLSAKEQLQNSVAHPDLFVDHKKTTAAVNRPSYSGKSEYFTAAEFLQLYESYLDLSFGRTSNAFKLKFVPQCLVGPARLWFRALSYLLYDWCQFKQLFLKHFWSERMQHSFSEKISFGQYVQKSEKTRMSEYFLLNITKARYLNYPPPEGQLVKNLSWHFPLNIRHRMAGLNSIACAYEFLLEEDWMLEFQMKLDRLRGSTDKHGSNRVWSVTSGSSGGGGCNGPI